ncbi:MAG: alpha/beta hydrolase [Thermoplasmata archaeon]|nr:alpha/beta hydrolase [Thermoplasmata archaeon]
MWDRELPRYARRRRVVRYDVRGLGRSPPAHAPYRDVDDLAALLDGLGLDQTTLVGVSNGGRLAVDFALEFPDRVDRLVVASPAVSGFAPRPGTPEGAALSNLSSAIQRIERDYAAGRIEATIDRLLALWCRARTAAGERRQRRMMRENLAEIVTDGSARFGRSPTPPAWGRLRSIRCPTLVIEGGRDAPLFQLLARDVATKIPHAVHVRLPDADHLANLSQPRAFDRAVRAFLD